MKIFLAILTFCILISIIHVAYSLIAFRGEIITNEAVKDKIVGGAISISILTFLVTLLYYLVFIKNIEFKEGDGVPPA